MWKYVLVPCYCTCNKNRKASHKKGAYLVRLREGERGMERERERERESQREREGESLLADFLMLIGDVPRGDRGLTGRATRGRVRDGGVGETERFVGGWGMEGWARQRETGGWARQRETEGGGGVGAAPRAIAAAVQKEP